MSTLAAPIHVLRLIDNHAEFSGLPLAEQARVLVKLDWVDRVMKAGQGMKEAIVRAAAAELDISPGSIRRYQTDFLRNGWRALKDTRVRGVGSGGPPQAFKSWVQSLHFQTQRATTGREVYRIVIERWSKWRATGDSAFAIPGYAFPPLPGPKGHPRGWSEDQILRLRPDAYALAAARQGAKDASDFLPSILKTRYGTRFGQVVFFDDQDYDLKVVAPGLSQRSLRPQGFNSLDYLSACFLDHSIRLRWWDASKDQYRTLTGMEATWFIIAHLQRHGWRTDADGTVLVVEHGTMNGYANMDLSTPDGFHRLEDAIKAVTNGKVTTERSGLFNHPAFSGMLFRPQSSGNPNFKAPLESIFNLVRNRMAALPGATGRNRDEAPAEQYGADLYVKQLLKVWDRLDDRHREAMRFPLLTASQFGNAALAVYQAINSRTDHVLEGWDRCGFKVPLFRFDESSSWLTQGQLAAKIAAAPHLAAAVDALMTIPGHVTPASLSPVQVADMHRGELTRLPDHLVPLLIPVQWAREATVNSEREIVIKDQLLGPEPFAYIARTENRDGAFVLKPGTTVRAYLNPHLPEKLILTRTDGSFLGTIHQKTRAGFMDQEAIVAQLHQRAAMKADLDTAVRPHLEDVIEHRGEMKRVNDRLAADKPVLPDEIRDARVSAGHKASRTAAANRLHGRGKTVDWDAHQMPAAPAPASAFDSLPDDEPLPPAL